MGLISRMVMGMLIGIALMAAWSYMMAYRSRKRAAKTVDIKLLSSLNKVDMKKICGDNCSEWISFPVFEQVRLFVKWLNKQMGKLWSYVLLPIGSFTLKAVGGSLTAIPGISDMIDDTVNTIVMDMLQWPPQYCCPHWWYTFRYQVFDQDIEHYKVTSYRVGSWKSKDFELRLLPSLDVLKIKDKKDGGTVTLQYHEFNKDKQLAALQDLRTGTVLALGPGLSAVA
ncbi:calcium-dependent lipid-binding family protein [Striga asiatica]|uniref:Calcium-dependent lipid-binding family protein n=1 Tax=Striga asiatica TaxID=4170 RepID=A0A5A7RJX4_STRAF|nr:calcium-dependent lipid-binding family protein [Striga asiatica]